MTLVDRKKRVVYFIPEFPRLSETFIQREVLQLINSDKLNIQVLSLKSKGDFLDEKMKAHVFYINMDFSSMVLGLVKYLPAFFKNISWFSSTLWSGLSSSENKVAVMALFIKSFGYAYIFNEYKPDQIHSHFMSWPSTIGLFVSKLLGVPLSISGHARDVFVDGQLIKEKVDSSKFVHICNGYAYNKCLELGGKNAKNKIYKVHHGVDIKDFDVKITKIKPDKPVIFIGSRLEEKKGLTYLIEASRLLKDQNIPHEIHIAGPGSMFSELVQLVGELGLRDCVFIHGDGVGVPYPEIVQFLKIADIYVLPSIVTGWGDSDGVPNVIIEAALAEVPVVTTNAGSITDLIIDGESGIIVPQKDSKALAEALGLLIGNPSLRKKYAMAAKKRAIEKFNLKENVSKLEDIFLNI